MSRVKTRRLSGQLSRPPLVVGCLLGDATEKPSTLASTQLQPARRRVTPTQRYTGRWAISRRCFSSEAGVSKTLREGGSLVSAFSSLFGGLPLRHRNLRAPRRLCATFFRAGLSWSHVFLVTPSETQLLHSLRLLSNFLARNFDWRRLVGADCGESRYL